MATEPSLLGAQGLAERVRRREMDQMAFEIRHREIVQSVFRTFFRRAAANVTGSGLPTITSGRVRAISTMTLASRVSPGSQIGSMSMP